MSNNFTIFATYLSVAMENVNHILNRLIPLADELTDGFNFKHK